MSFCRRPPTAQRAGQVLHAKFMSQNGAFLVPLLDAFLLKIDSKIGATFVLPNQNAPLCSSEVYDKSRRFFLRLNLLRVVDFVVDFRRKINTFWLMRRRWFCNSGFAGTFFPTRRTQKCPNFGYNLEPKFEARLTLSPGRGKFCMQNSWPKMVHFWCHFWMHLCSKLTPKSAQLSFYLIKTHPFVRRKSTTNPADFF